MSPNEMATAWAIECQYPTVRAALEEAFLAGFEQCKATLPGMIYEAFKDIDGGCPSCRVRFLDTVPQEMAQALVAIAAERKDDVYVFNDGWEIE